MVTNLELYI